MQQQAQEFNKMRYAQFMCNELGIATTYIKDAEVEALADAASINKYLLGVTQQVQASTDHVLSPDDQALLNSKVTLSNSPQVAAHNTTIANALNNIRSRNNDIEGYFRQIRDARMKLQEILRTPTKNIAEIVADIQRTLPFKYNAKDTQNTSNVWFIYDKFDMKYTNAEQKVDMTVPMGPYAIEWEPVSGNLRVHPEPGALQVDGYPHPHVEGGGAICWGNGREAAHQALQTYDLKTALIILERVLKTYNPDSPYVRLDRFASLLDPCAEYGTDYHMQRYGNQWGWIRLQNSSSHQPIYNVMAKLDIVRQPNSGRLTEAIGPSSYVTGLVPLYRILHKDTKTRAPSSSYYTKIEDRYYRLSEGHTYGHETVEDITKHRYYPVKEVPF